MDVIEVAVTGWLIGMAIFAVLAISAAINTVNTTNRK